MSSAEVRIPIVDHRLGLIREVTRQPRRPGLPPQFRSYVSQLADLDLAGGRPDPFTQGSALSDGSRGWWAAVGEAMERYCGNAVPTNLRRATAADLAAAGHALAIGHALYSVDQYATPGFPFQPITDTTTIRWVSGIDLRHDSPVLVPAAFAYVNLPDRTDPDPPLVSPLYAGIAAGTSQDQARLAALLEVIERDAMTIWWYGRGPTVTIDVSDDPVLHPVLAAPSSTALRYTFVTLPATVSVPVIGCFVEDTAHGFVAFGSACRPDPAEAARKAAAEAIGQLALSADLDDPDSELWRSFAWHPLGQHVYTDHRLDRAYLDVFGPEWRSMTDLPANTQLYLDPRVQDLVRHRWESADSIVSLNDLAVLRDPNPLQALIGQLASDGLQTVAVDLTASDVRRGGFVVSRVLVPGYVGNAPAAFPLLGGSRLWQEPVRRGWEPTALSEAAVLTTPPPPYC